MKKSSLYDLLCEINEKNKPYRFFSKNRIIDHAVAHYHKLLVYKDIVAVAEIILKDFSENFSMEENLDMAIYDYINQK